MIILGKSKAMTNLMDYLRIEILDDCVLLKAKSTRIKQYLDYLENKVGYREFSIGLNRMCCITSSNQINEFFCDGTQNLKWLISRELNSGITHEYKGMIVKTDFNRWINQM